MRIPLIRFRYGKRPFPTDLLRTNASNQYSNHVNTASPTTTPTQPSSTQGNTTTITVNGIQRTVYRLTSPLELPQKYNRKFISTKEQSVIDFGGAL